MSHRLVILGGGIAGWWFFRDQPIPPPADHHEIRLSRRTGIVCWAVFFLLLIGLPIVSLGQAGGALDLFQRFYRVG